MNEKFELNLLDINDGKYWVIEKGNSDTIIATLIHTPQHQAKMILKRINNWDEAIELLNAVQRNVMGGKGFKGIEEFLNKVNENDKHESNKLP